jgi:hypothetical protein
LNQPLLISVMKEGQEYKASGILSRADGVPMKVTVSGWSQKSTALEHQLDNDEWSTKARRGTCRGINHTLPLSAVNRGVSGRFEASHVENQLLAYVYSTLDVFRDADQRSPAARREDEMDWVQTFDDLFLERSIIVHVDAWNECEECQKFATRFCKENKVDVTLVVNGQV